MCLSTDHALFFNESHYECMNEYSCVHVYAEIGYIILAICKYYAVTLGS